MRLSLLAVLTVLVTVALAASAGAASSRIVYDADSQDTGTDLWTVKPDGSARKRLTNNKADDIAPSWAPNKQRIVFVRISDGIVLNLIKPDGHGVKPIAHTRYGGDPAWSPKGDLIAYHAFRGLAQNYYIYTIKPNGKDRKRLTGGPADFNPSWSPDGRLIVFNRGGEIWKMRADGSHEKRIWKDGHDPVWSPDGKHIAFSMEREDQPRAPIWTIRPDGTHLHQVSQHDSSFDCGGAPSSCVQHNNPTWSPGGTKLAYDATSENTGSLGIFATPFPKGDSESQVVSAGLNPDW